MGNSIYYYIGSPDETRPTEKTINTRNEMLKQIKKSNYKLKPIHKIEFKNDKYKIVKTKNKRSYSDVVKCKNRFVI